MRGARPFLGERIAADAGDLAWSNLTKDQKEILSRISAQLFRVKGEVIMALPKEPGFEPAVVSRLDDTASFIACIAGDETLPEDSKRIESLV